MSGIVALDTLGEVAIMQLFVEVVNYIRDHFSHDDTIIEEEDEEDEDDLDDNYATIQFLGEEYIEDDEDGCQSNCSCETDTERVPWEIEMEEETDEE